MNENIAHKVRYFCRNHLLESFALTREKVVRERPRCGLKEYTVQNGSRE